MKCPDCLEEVMEGDLDCPYCGACLDEEIECEPEEEKGLSHLLSLSDESEAYAIKELLENSGIPVIIQPLIAVKDRGGLDYGPDTWGDILVNGADLDNSLSIVQKYMDARRALLIQDEDSENEEESD